MCYGMGRFNTKIAYYRVQYLIIGHRISFWYERLFRNSSLKLLFRISSNFPFPIEVMWWLSRGLISES